MPEQPTDPQQLSILSHPQPADPPLGASLEPVLRRICEDRLSAISWFRTDWQRGGALTGYATFQDDHQKPVAVVVKLPVGPGERQWLVRLQDIQDVAPQIYAHGDTLGGYDMAWIVMERLAYGPLSPAWGGAQFDLLIDAVTRFYAVANTDDASEPLVEDWKQILTRARRCVQVSGYPDTQRWNTVLKKAQRKIKQWIQIWDDRPTDQVCHGDFHLGNAMTRKPPPDGPAILFDFALTRKGHWIEDAVYLEHLYWAQRQLLDGRKLCNLIARGRKSHGLSVTSHWPQIAAARRAMLALSTPLRFQKEPDLTHLKAALEMLEIQTQ